MPRPRLLAPSRVLRETPQQAGGGRDRKALVARARASMAKGSRSFAIATRLFDRTTRERVWLLYAWCRRCDDIADAQDHGGKLGERSDPAKALRSIRLLTNRALDGLPTADPAFDALGLVARETGLTGEMAEDVIEGFALDAADWRPRSEMDLMRYCYHVAGAIGVMMARVMGVPPDDAETLDRAADLGLSFQLTNIARDIAEDAAAGRCYLPLEWLAEMDIEPGELMKPHHRPQLVRLARRLTDLSRRHRAAALVGTRALAFRQRWAIHAAARIYGEIAEEVDRRGAAAWDRRVVVSRRRKAGHVTGAYLDAMRRRHPAPEAMPRHDREAILIEIRMAGPIPEPTITPLRDE